MIVKSLPLNIYNLVKDKELIHLTAGGKTWECNNSLFLEYSETPQCTAERHIKPTLLWLYL